MNDGVTARSRPGALHRPGGVTGDVFGCLIELTESCLPAVFRLPQGEV